MFDSKTAPKTRHHLFLMLHLISRSFWCIFLKLFFQSHPWENTKLFICPMQYASESTFAAFNAPLTLCTQTFEEWLYLTVSSFWLLRPEWFFISSFFLGSYFACDLLQYDLLNCLCVRESREYKTWNNSMPVQWVLVYLGTSTWVLRQLDRQIKQKCVIFSASLCHQLHVDILLMIVH